MIDVKQPIRFFDDTGRDKDYIYASRILFQSKGICVVRIEDSKDFNIIDNIIVFEIESKKVLTHVGNMTFWQAENYDPRHKPATTGEIDGELE